MEESITKVFNQSSVEITRNTKGFTYSVKAYGSSVDEIKINTDNLIAFAEVTIKGLESKEVETHG
ncbi:MAG: hypothetical protein WC307_06115 [Candidatus Nanoarchaeia archaeon]|jgi:hypothetical protein